MLAFIRKSNIFLASLLLFSIFSIHSFDWFSKKPEAPSYIGFFSIFHRLNNARPIISVLRNAAKNPNIKGLIIHMDCRGGLVGTSQAIFSELKKFKKNKPVIIVVENYCLSGAYYIALAADYIFALPSSQIGSIGVICTPEQHKNLTFKNNDMKGELAITVLKVGKYKAMLNPNLPLNNDELEYMHALMVKEYNQFVNDVIQERHLSIAEKDFADGHMFVGSDALQLGLIDAIGDFTDAIEKMKKILLERNIPFAENIDILTLKDEPL